MVVATVAAGKEADLRAVLDAMNFKPGVVNPHNEILPFASLERLHFARLVILDDRTAADIAAYGLTPHNFPKTLAFLGDCDGPAQSFLNELASLAENGLRKVFSHCEGFEQGSDVLRWLTERSVTPAANYINWIGRTMRQVREECALRDALVGFV